MIMLISRKNWKICFGLPEFNCAAYPGTGYRLLATLLEFLPSFLAEEGHKGKVVELFFYE
jgi:hypothetical protein